MPLPGGEADKLGNRYEGRWTVFNMIDVMEEKADYIRLEQPGEDAFEFFVLRDGQRECHQVKRQRSDCGSWTLSALETHQVKVLSGFWQSLNDPNNNCLFISTQDANELRELASRARDSISWQEFEEQYLNKTQSGNFHKLRQKWENCSELGAYEALKRVFVHTVDDDILASIIENRLEALLAGDPKVIRLELTEFVLEKIHHELTAFDIWHYLLGERGYSRREWSKDLNVLSAIERANSAYLSTLQEAKIGGEVLPRNEASIILEKIAASSGKGSVLVVGEAGIGKSGAISQVLDMLKDDGIPFLAFRIDRLEPEVIPDAVGTQLGLPASPPTVLANIAQNRDCVLVIDQLDAVSLVSGRNPQFFDCISQLINQAKAHPNIHLLLACRKFDLENDNRFKHLTGQDGIAEAVNISRLPTSVVKEVVAKLGLEVSGFSEKQLLLLSLPLHLSLLAEVIVEPNGDFLNFETAKDLYDQFWDYKQKKIRERLGHSIRWTQVIDILCNYMSDHQVLSAPEIFLDEVSEDAGIMASEHVLLKENKRISFFHESFFDYAFARRFFGCGKSLLPFLVDNGQHLFQRSQVRQILLHERDFDFEQYKNDLTKLLSSSSIRFHIKQVVCSTLTLIASPHDDEWKILAMFLENDSSPISNEIWKLLNSSLAWFNLLESKGVIKKWLDGEEDIVIDRVVNLLSIMQCLLPSKVADLVKPYINTSEAWNDRLIFLVQRIKLETARPIFDLFLELLSSGVFDKQEDDFFFISDEVWDIVFSLNKHCPDWCCEFLEVYLKHLLQLSIASGSVNPFPQRRGCSQNTGDSYSTVLGTANTAPGLFCLRIIPTVLEIIGLNKKDNEKVPWQDLVWTNPFDYQKNDPNQVKFQIIIALEQALSRLSQEESEFLDDCIHLLKTSSFELPQYLLIRIYTAHGEKFADEAVDYLCENPSRLKASYSHEQFWASRKLIEAITPFCSSQKLEQLEMMLLKYFPHWEKGRGIQYGYHGHAQFILLDGIEVPRRSKKVARRVAELYRKFNRQPQLRYKGMTVANVTPPVIPKSATEKMTDEQWLKAIAKYDLTEISRDKDSSLLDAGALSKFLEEQSSQEPERFSKLLSNLPDNTNIRYYEAILYGISQHMSFVCLQTLQGILHKCHQLPGHPCGKAICLIFRQFSDWNWSQEDFNVVNWYALNSSDPKEEIWRNKAEDGQLYCLGDIHTSGINSVRGSAAITIAKLIYSRKSRATVFWDTTQNMLHDCSIAVKTCIIEILIATLNYDRNLSVETFLNLGDSEDLLLGTQNAENFLYFALQTHFEILKPIVEKMLSSDLPSVATVSARQACVAAMHTEEALPLAELCLNGTQTHRLAAAEVFVNNLRSAYLKEFCENSLIQLFSDPSSEVRARAAKCFSRLETELDSYFNLIDQFIETEAFSDGDHDLIRALEKTTSQLPKSTYRVCERFIQGITDEDAQKRAGALRDITSVSQLLVRLYSQSGRDLVLQSQCLDLIDQMIEIGAYGLEKSLAPFER
ncbi:hypothetical protein IQ273_07570 [Nodosilinea sp. LEGE 07298]|uniref:hypothetical protein n=1 Tax=Nodosilinea sp. LEGE 07298 TaxID=2777970 RepID=UPI00187F17F3|nr:hypothetical protein [Nodosilinea sp. LEGE 07298]MBE9109272.1 hypothetical protein [Nodosilinea sp. LEGE 07298]